MFFTINISHDPIMFIMTAFIRVCMAKLQKQVAYKYKGHKIYKYRINVPSEAIEHLKWEHGTELSVYVKDNKLEIERVK